MEQTVYELLLKIDNDLQEMKKDIKEIKGAMITKIKASHSNEIEIDIEYLTTKAITLEKRLYRIEKHLDEE